MSETIDAVLDRIEAQQPHAELDVLELARIVEALKGDARIIFSDILSRRGGAKLGKGR